MSKPKIITFTSLKGGTGKTLITFNVATLLARKYRKKVLVIDFDPQHNASNLLYDPSKISKKSPMTMGNILDENYTATTEDIFDKGVAARALIKKSHINNLDVIPTTILMTAMEVKIAGIAGREMLMKNWLLDNADELEKYDYIFIDTNPTMSIVNINGFIVCDSIIIVSDIDADSINAVDTFMELYYPIQNRIDRSIGDNIKALLINKVREGNILNRDFAEFIESEYFGYKDLLLKTQIHDAVGLAETKIEKHHITKKRNERAYRELTDLIGELKARRIL